jgi:hypothetical protein
MAIQLDDRPEEDRIQRGYEDEFDALTSAEHQAKDGVSGDVGDDERGFFKNENDSDDNSTGGSGGESKDPDKRGGLFKDEDGKSDKAGRVAGGLSDIKGAVGAAGGNPAALAKLAGNFFFGSKRRRRATAAGGIGGGLATVAVIGFFFVSTMKVESVIQNVNEEFGAASSQAVDTMVQYQFRQWVIKYIAPNLGHGTCHSTIDPGCVKVAPGSGPMSQLYNGWRQDRLEQKLAKKFDVVIGKKGNTYYINSGGKTINFGDNVSDVFSDSGGTAGERHEIERILSSRLKNGTKWDRLYYRFKIAPLLKAKYGIRYCINACKPINKFTDSLSVKKKAAKAYTVQRVISPLSESYGLLIQCVMEGGCNNDLQDAEPGQTTKQTELNHKLQAQLVAYAANNPPGSLDKLLKNADEVSKEGFQKYFIRTLAGKVAGQAAGAATAEIATKAIPPIGLLILFAQMEHFANTIGPTVQNLTYAANSAAAAQTFAMYQTVASEQKSGQIDAAQLGSFNEALSTNLDGTGEDASDAASTPLYQSVVAKKDSSSGTSAEYLCNDGEPVPAGETVCDEEVLNRGNKRLNEFSQISRIVGNPVAADVIVKVVNAATGILNKAIEPFFNATCKFTPGCTESMAFLASKAADLMNFVVNKLVVSPITDSMSGGRTFDMIAAGADVSHNNSCQENLGCPHVDDKTAATVRSDYIANQRESFSHQTLFARMFSTDTPYSLVSRLAVQVPGSTSNSGNRMVALMAHDPFSALSNTIGSMFAPHTASAAVGASDPFGVPQAAYAPSDIPKDPEGFFANNCTDGPLAKYDTATNTVDISDWLNTPGNVTQDKDTLQAVLAKPNPCLLIFSSLQASGGLSDPSLLPQDVLTEDETSSDTGAGTSVKLATFNVFHSDDQAASVWQARMRRSVKVLKDGHVTVAGLQETRANQQNYFKQNDVAGDVYDMYPLKSSRPDFTPNPIVWDKSKFKLVNGTKHNIKYGADGTLNVMVEVTLEDLESGQQFIVLNTHDPADVRGGNAAQDRFDNSNANVALISQLKQRGLPILFTGDFNNRYSVTSGGGNQPLGNKRENLTYCILTKNGDMQDAYDKKSGACPSTSAGSAGNPVDHMFISTGLGVTYNNFAVIGKSGTGNNGSDAHDTLAVDVTIPASGESGGTTASEGVAWPVDQKWWNSNKSLFLKPHSGAGTFTAPNTGNVSADISLPKGTPVYALAGGNVIKKPLGRSSRICTGVPNPDNNGGLEISSQIQGGTLLVAYAHGDSVTTKATMNAGDKIMNVGQVGNACGAHLHIDMSFNNKNVCPQDVFLALGNGQTPDFAALAAKAVAPCGR